MTADADTPARKDAKCPRCAGSGWAWQWRTYGHAEMHGDYYEQCDDCGGTGLAAARHVESTKTENKS